MYQRRRTHVIRFYALFIFLAELDSDGGLQYLRNVPTYSILLYGKEY
jgi:hypothetical protein